MWEEISSYLQNIKIPFDLYVSITNDTDKIDTINDIIQKYPSAVIVQTPNIGSDVGGFIELFNEATRIKKSYEYVLKLHTKKSEMTSINGDGYKIRHALFDSLLGSEKIVNDNIRHLERFGMVGPKKYFMSKSTNDKKAGYEINRENMTHLLNKLNIKNSELKFFSGTMFWVRWDILEKYLSHKLTIEDFNESHKPDGTMAHAMERVFPCMVRDMNYKIKCI